MPGSMSFGFLRTMIIRSVGVTPDGALKPIASLTLTLATVAMAALGLSVELRTALAAGALPGVGLVGVR